MAEVARQALPGYGGQTFGKHGVGQSIYAQSATPKEKLGSRLKLGPRTFYYAEAGEGLTIANMTAFNVTLNEEDTPTVAHGIGTTELTVTAAATITRDQFAQGMLWVHDDSGGDSPEGDQYVIKSNKAIASAATGVVTIYEPGLVTAWATIANMDITFGTNPFYDVKQAAAATASGAGIPLLDISSGYFFWLQTYGPAVVLIKTAANSGAAAAEQAMAIDTSGDLIKAIAGDAISAISLRTTADTVTENGDYGYVFLTCVA